MASVINLYRDGNCKDPILQVSPGVAGVVGYYSNVNNWTIYPINTGLVNDAGKPLLIYATYINQDKNGNLKRRGCDFGFTFSGGSVLYDFNTSGTIIPIDIRTTDKVNSSPGAGNITNAFFTGQMTYEGDLVRTGYVRFSEGIYERSVVVSFGSYYQEPEDATMANRQTWMYNTSVGYDSTTATFCQSVLVEFNSNTRWHYCKMYSITIDEIDCYAFFIGVDFDGSINDSNTDDPGSEYFHSTYIVAVPKDLYKDRVPKPYVGPVTPESAAGITPPSRGLYDDTIRPRDIDENHQNPFGFNEGNGVYLVMQDSNQNRYFLDGLYHGKDEVSGMGTIDGAIGYARRPAEQIQVMTQGVLSCKLMPKFTVNGLNVCNKYTVCGYSLGSASIWAGLGGVGTTVNEIALVRKDFGFITRTYYNFLDFEPYTTMTLHIPFLGDVAIDPSVVYDNRIILHGYVDYFTGLLSLSIVLQKDAAHSYIYTTLQGNCAIDVPIVGAGSSSTQAIGKIASGLGKFTANPVNGVFGVLQGISQVGKSIPITQNAQSSLAAMFSPRSVYLTINTPLPENPSNYAALMGTVVRKEGTVGKYTGYSEFSAVNLNTVVATDAEKEEIERLLRTGVFV